ncbi:MAG: exo-alpha-sialidase [Dehalococcoidia bacterium]|nr:exo-alpha-sialidase [Dehalococcoidia bacterium]
MPDQVKVLVGTRKGAFIYTSDRSRESWDISEPILPGWAVYQMAIDGRGDAPRFYAAANHWAWGRSVAKSDAGAKDWDVRSEGLGFPQDMGVTVGNVWHVTPGLASEPGVVYAGTQPAGLFRSDDWGASWKPVDELNRSEERKYWLGSGGGDSALHSIEVDPRDARRIYVAVSAGGGYTTRDGGTTWEIFSHAAIPQTMSARQFVKELMEMFPEQEIRPGIDPMAIDEMHNMRLDQKNPDRIWAQTHVGVFRSDDQGVTFEDVTEGLPSFHGFPLAVTKRGPDATYVVPLEFQENNFRVCPGQFAVYRTADLGKTWERLTTGLPGPHDYQSAYREALDTDGVEREGVYVGTTNGEVHASADGGDHWQRLPGTLPPILSVTAGVG